MANSRALLRSDTLLSPWPSGRGRLWAGGAQLARKLRHLDGGKASFETLVTALQSRAVNGLLEGVASQHAKDNGQAAIHLRELQAARGFRADVIVVRGFAPQDTAD